ncbi:MAG: hypothetical protein RL368_1278 [Pseudomonadota bacterium]|jgi:hypothetical protein
MIEERILLLEEILNPWEQVIGDDFLGYKNHVYRMIHFCFALHACDVEARQKIIIAACFHDVGIWTEKTVDYLPPSIHYAKDYLTEQGLEAWIPEVELMIEMHHKMRVYHNPAYPLVEIFRQGDLIDFSLGFVKQGLSQELIDRVKVQFPNAGFHKRLLQLAIGWFSKHPFSPPPFMKW